MWAPIMGVGYDRPIAQFALNDYPDADLGGPNPSLQANPDDVVTITQFGAGFRSDEPGTSIANAGPVPVGSAYIHNRTDVDYFSLGSCSGNVTVNASNAPVSPNLDIELQLLNAGGNLIDTDNPPSAFVNRDVASGMDASASGSSLPTGQYYARVDGIGRGSATTSYTDYGSIGAYTLQVSGCGNVVPVTPPSMPLNLAGLYLGGNAVQLTWSAPADDGGSPLTGYNVYEDGVMIGSAPPDSTGGVVGQVPSGVRDYGVAAVNAEGEGPQAHVLVDATDNQPEEATPGKPRIGKAKPGKRGGKKTVKISWRPPTLAANPAIDGYKVIAYKLKRVNGKLKYVKVTTSPLYPASKLSTTLRGNGKYKFAVRARNDLGFGPKSRKSNAARAR